MGTASGRTPSSGEVSEYRHLPRMLLRSDGLLERAEAALQCAATADANDAAAWHRLGDVQRGKGQLAEALECYRRAASLRPNDPRTAWLIALLSGSALPEPPAGGDAAPFVRQTGFLPPERWQALIDLALASRERFAPAIVNVLPGSADAAVPPPLQKHPPATENGANGRVDPSRRKALILDPRITQAGVRPWFEPPLRRAFAEALPRLGLHGPRAQRIELGLSAYLGGSFFAKHKDNGASASHTRLASFAYYFNRRPQRFSGGDLLLYDAEGNAFTRIQPEHNSIVFFPAACVHQITPVEGELEGFGDARFVLHGGVRSEVDGG